MQRSCPWITGVGVVSAAGADVESTLDSFQQGQRNFSQTLPFESVLRCPTFQVAAELPVLPGRLNNSRSLRLTMKAVKEAIASAGIENFSRQTRVGICLGTTVASQLNNVAFYDGYRREKGAGDMPMYAVYDYLQANLGHAVGELLSVSGPQMTVVNACSSATDAIGVAAQWLHAGLCDVAIAGGADELNRVALAGFWSLGVVSGQPCAPFDRNRCGLNLGEGAGIVVMESSAHAAARGKMPAFEVAGFGAACDGHHLTAPHPDGRGLESAIRTALTQAQISPSQVAFINAHGTATLDNDRAEGKVIARIFGENTSFLSTKGYTGHTLGAAGGVEAVFTLLGLRERWIPASAGFENQPEDIPVTPIRERTTIDGEYGMSISLAFGGNNSAIILRRVGR